MKMKNKTKPQLNIRQDSPTPRSQKSREIFTAFFLLFLAVGMMLLVSPRPSMATTPPCGTWSHSGWSSGTVTWTKNSSGCWSATISAATETCVWSDPCAHTTKPDDVHSVGYSNTFSGLAKPDPSDSSTWYFEARFEAASSCDGGSDVVISTHPYDDCQCECTCGQ